jgi:hypothetical protein
VVGQLERKPSQSLSRDKSRPQSDESKLTADQKIAALIAMNEKEIKATMAAASAAATGANPTPSRQKPALVDGKKPPALPQKSRGLHTAVIELPSVFAKKG